jgi:hypothetical protein
MKKSDSLRAAIIAANQALARDPERLLIFAENGTSQSYSTGDPSFSLNYDLTIVIISFAGDPAEILMPIHNWLLINQPDLAVPDAEAIRFQADILDNNLVDVQFTISLREQVRSVRRADGGFDMQYMDEPEKLFDTEDWDLPSPPVPLTSAIIGSEILPFQFAPSPIHPGLFRVETYDRQSSAGLGYATALNPDYTAQSPLIFAAGERLFIPIAGYGIDELTGIFAGYDYLDGGRFVPRAFNDVFDLRLTFTGSSGFSGNRMRVELDIGGGQGVIDGDEYSFAASAGDISRLVFKYMNFARQTFLDNGGGFYGRADKDCAIWDIQLLFLPRAAAARPALI